MRFTKMGYLVAAITVVVMLAFYVRRAPVAPKLDVPQVAADTELAGGFIAVRPFDGNADDLIARITQIALATPRTQKLSDNPLQFVTRSRVVGFPDVTSVDIQDGVMLIHAHLVYGKFDMGVNKARVLDWLDRLGPL
ncbi:MAG: hypothetical protein ACJAXK_001016 [Yoonia sp.]|jgi:uncharacterized protein (DUF1499 family)